MKEIVYNGKNYDDVLSLCRKVWPDAFIRGTSDLLINIYSNAGVPKFQFIVIIGDIVRIVDDMPQAFRLGKEKGNADNLVKAVEGLDQFCKNWCMNCAETERTNEPFFQVR